MIFHIFFFLTFKYQKNFYLDRSLSAIEPTNAKIALVAHIIEDRNSDCFSLDDKDKILLLDP